MTVVDSHLHVWVLRPEKYPWQNLLSSLPEEEASAELLFKHMDENGVDKAVLVQPSFYGYDNSYAADCLERYSDRLAGVCMVDPLDEKAPSQLEHWVKDQGFQGLRLHPHRQHDPTWLNDKKAFPLWEKAAELGIPICFLILPHQMGRLEDMVKRFPTVKVVIDHLGRPVVEKPPYPSFKGILKIGEYPNAYIKVSGHYGFTKEPYPYADTHVFVKIAYEVYGPRRMLWGTDFPWILKHCGYTKALGLVRDNGFGFLTQEDKEWILGKTSLSLWRFGC